MNEEAIFQKVFCDRIRLALTESIVSSKETLNRYKNIMIAIIGKDKMNNSTQKFFDEILSMSKIIEDVVIINEKHIEKYIENNSQFSAVFNRAHEYIVVDKQASIENFKSKTQTYKFAGLTWYKAL